MVIFQLALKAILLNKVRSFLTMLGVIIGVASVVLLSSIGTGLSLFVTESFESLGSNNIIVFPSQVISDDGNFGGGDAAASSIANTQLTLEEVKDIEKLDVVRQAAPFNMQNDKVSYKNNEEDTSVLGTSHNYSEVFGTDIEKGKFFSKVDNLSREKVTILGHTLAEDLFGAVDPIGKKVTIGTQGYRVIGVAEKVGSQFGGPSFDEFAYIPIQSFFDAYDTKKIIRIIVQLKDKDRIQEGIEAVEAVLSETLEEDEFDVVDQSEILNAINNILGVLTVAVSGIASISLFVGGIGIMNIMLVSVTERTREIGLRKALGATPSVILFQFLVEAALLSVIGGVIGMVIAYIGSLFIQIYFPAQVTIGAVVLAFTVSLIVGLIFGAAPARRAAKLSPIEALRFE